MFYTQFFLTRNCTKYCYYCSVFKGHKETEVDMDYLKYVLEYIPQNSAIEMTGGEIGLVTNIDDVFKTIYDHKNVKKVLALSNGYLRVIGVDWLDKVEYSEHLIYDINGRDIEKFYDLDFTDKGKTVLVTTEKTTRSILENMDYFRDMGLFTDKFFIKIMNQKTHDISKYWYNVFELYTRLNDEYHINMALAFINKNKKPYDIKRNICMKNPPHCFIDFESDEIGHCAVLFHKSKRAVFNPENYVKLMKGELFDACDYCSGCYNYDDGLNKIENILRAKKGEYHNRSYEHDSRTISKTNDESGMGRQCKTVFAC